jgi:beta-glucanase (GH16 family)
MLQFLAISLVNLALPSNTPDGRHDSPTSGRHLVFSEDFRRARTINLKTWKFDDGPVYNDEQEKYTSPAAGNAFLKNGCLVLEARKEKNGQITSARLQSVKAWKFCYVEVEAKVPTGRGTWPAIWMLNDRLRHPLAKDHVDWPKCGEIDIMENVGFDAPKFHFSLHSQNFNFMRKEQRTSIITVPNPTAFHKFGMDWRPESITFTYDGKSVYNVERGDPGIDSWPYVDPYYLILNLAIGGTWGGAKGIDDKIFPCQLLVRSVRVYQ